jgi:hypothetical protein
MLPQHPCHVLWPLCAVEACVFINALVCAFVVAGGVALRAMLLRRLVVRWAHRPMRSVGHPTSKKNSCSELMASAGRLGCIITPLNAIVVAPSTACVR